jgi:hypothetical protein
MTSDKNYRMTKLTKIMLSNILDDTLRSTYKKLFVSAEYQSAHLRKKMSVKVVETDDE